MRQDGPEHGHDQRQREVEPADRDERPAQGLRTAFANLPREAGAEDEVVDVCACGQQGDERDLDPEHRVEAGRCVARLVRGR